MPAAAKLTKRQAALLERVCLRRYTVRLNHYMGSFRPNESVDVEERVPMTDEERRSGQYGIGYADGTRGVIDCSFRPQTVASLRRAGLVQYTRSGSAGTSIVVPTHAGLDWYRATHPAAK